MRKIEREKFADAAREGRGFDVCLRLAQTGNAQVEAGSRIASFIFSDNSVDRYGDTIDARGWQLDKFLQNPVALFGHDAQSVENVIGKARNVRVEGNRLVGDIEFVEASVNPAAETVLQMVKGGFLNAVSVGFAPLEWAIAKDKSRPGGVDFKKQELLEISIVPIPANANALVQARAAGIDVDRLKLATPPIKVKSLWHVAWLADILMDLDLLEDCVSWETAAEGDDSLIADRLATELNALGQILVDMTIEEVTELLTDDDEGDGEALDGVVEMSAHASRMAILKSLAGADATGLEAARRAIAPREKAGLVDLIAGLAAKAGKVLSSDNEQKIRDAIDLHTKGVAMMNDVIGAACGGDKSAEIPDDGRALRSRRARALAQLGNF